MKNRLLTACLSLMLLCSACSPAIEEVGPAPAEEAPGETTPADTNSPSNPEPPADTPDSTDEESTTEMQQIGVEQNAGIVEITIPAILLGDTDAAEIIASAAEEEVEVTVNADGSATFLMTPAQHQMLLRELAEGIQETFDLLVEDEDIDCYKAITANADFTLLNLTVDQEAFENDFLAQFYLLMVVIGPSYYQLFDGKGDDIQLQLDFYNEAGQLFDTQYYPE